VDNKILIIDFGSQFTLLIARRVRELGFYSEIMPCSAAFEKFTAFSPSAIILSGGPSSVYENNAPDIDAEIFRLNLPILGICYGQQLMCSKLGGMVESSEAREFGKADIQLIAESDLFAGIAEVGDTNTVWMSHGDKINKIPDGFTAMARSDSTPYAVIGDVERKIYGIQFHPEVVHTRNGARIINNFLTKVASLTPDWQAKSYKDLMIDQARQVVGNGRVICAVSGGVDSSVVAVLLHQAIGAQLFCVFVDTGMLRLGEAEQVVKTFRESFNIPLIHEDASDLFLGKLEGVDDPERKRKIIGETFIEVFEKRAEQLKAEVGNIDFLAQGTLYPDVIESVSYSGGPSATIKSHHNVGGLPARMRMKLVEPLRSLFKDEVRKLGRELGIPEVMVARHPFPGPGLAIRILGEVTRERLEILQKADAIYIEEIRKAGLYDKIWQAFAALLPVRSVGVMGDARTYEYTCALRAVTSEDGMTAEAYKFDMDFLSHVSNRIVNEVRGINRVVYDVTSKPPATIEWE
jgi:GMP synthase (glutamine-hydrolysing)